MDKNSRNMQRSGEEWDICRQTDSTSHKNPTQRCTINQSREKHNNIQHTVAQLYICIQQPLKTPHTEEKRYCLTKYCILCRCPHTGMQRSHRNMESYPQECSAGTGTWNPIHRNVALSQKHGNQSIGMQSHLWAGLAGTHHWAGTLPSEDWAHWGSVEWSLH